MFHRHRVGISFGLVITILGGGAFGVLVGRAVPGGVFGLTGNVAVAATGVLAALFAALVWSIGEAIVGLAGAAGKDATLLRLAISVGGSFLSLVTAGLDLVNVHLFSISPDPHSVFSYAPIASGFGAVALGAHALLHQLHLDRKLGH